MNTTTTSKVAREYRLKKWADEIRECNNRPTDLSIKDWCDQQGIKTANYYYRLREVRKACLAIIPEKQQIQQIIPIPATVTGNVSTQDPFLEVIANNVCIRVTETTSPELLKMVLQVTADVQ